MHQLDVVDLEKGYPSRENAALVFMKSRLNLCNREALSESGDGYVGLQDHLS